MDREPDEPGATWRASLSADGRLGPIERRLGRRLIRVVDPDGTEGRSLLCERRVQFVAPGGERLDHLSPEEALDRLRRRLESRLAEDIEGVESQAWDDGFARLEAWRARIGRA